MKAHSPAPVAKRRWQEVRMAAAGGAGRRALRTSCRLVAWAPASESSLGRMAGQLEEVHEVVRLAVPDPQIVAWHATDVHEQGHAARLGVNQERRIARLWESWCRAALPSTAPSTREAGDPWARPSVLRCARNRGLSRGVRATRRSLPSGGAPRRLARRPRRAPALRSPQARSPRLRPPLARGRDCGP
jgi:hypothetical protein